MLHQQQPLMHNEFEGITLSRREQDILAEICKFREQNHELSPSRRELVESLNLSWVVKVHRDATKLRRKGLLINSAKVVHRNLIPTELGKKIGRQIIEQQRKG